MGPFSSFIGNKPKQGINYNIVDLINHELKHNKTLIPSNYAMNDAIEYLNLFKSKFNLRDDEMVLLQLATSSLKIKYVNKSIRKDKGIDLIIHLPFLPESINPYDLTKKNIDYNIIDELLGYVGAEDNYGNIAVWAIEREERDDFIKKYKRDIVNKNLPIDLALELPDVIPFFGSENNARLFSEKFWNNEMNCAGFMLTKDLNLAILGLINSIPSYLQINNPNEKRRFQFMVTEDKINIGSDYSVMFKD